MSKSLIFASRSVYGVEVQQRLADGYLNATALAKAHYQATGQRRDVSEWLSNTRTQESIGNLSLKTGIPVFKLSEAKAIKKLARLARRIKAKRLKREGTGAGFLEKDYPVKDDKPERLPDLPGPGKINLGFPKYSGGISY